MSKHFDLIRLKNNLPVLLLPSHGQSQTASFFLLSQSGSEREKAHNKGLAHFLEHMSFKGSANYPQSSDISLTLDSLGANYNAYTSRQKTVYYASASRSSLETIISVITDFFSQPLLRPADLEKEKGVILEELRMLKDFPPDLAASALWPIIYGESVPAGWEIIGEEKTIQEMTIPKMRAFHQINYTTNNSLAIVSGKFNSDKVLSILEEKTKSLPMGKILKNYPQPQRILGYRSIINKKPTDQAHLIAAWPGLASDSESLSAITLLATILGGGMSSRLFIKLREELGVAYYCQAQHLALADRGLLMISAGLQQSSLVHSIRAIFEEISKLSETITEAELIKAKKILSGRLSLSLETSSGLASFFASRVGLENKIVTPQEYLAKLNEVKLREVQALARDIFKLEQLSLSIVGKNIKKRQIDQEIQQTFSS